MTRFRRVAGKLLCVMAVSAFATWVGAGCGSSSSSTPAPEPPQPPPAPPSPPARDTITVNSLADLETPPEGTVTLRAAVARAAASGEAIVFDGALDGGTIALGIVGEGHSVLKGEVYSGMTFQGYADRDYGRSALYARSSITIDASSLPHGITIAWTGGDEHPARVLAVYGDLTLVRVKVTGGYSVAEPIPESTAQPYTLARGGGLAVWGTATLRGCAVVGNRIKGDPGASRDRGAYGGGIYADGLNVSDSLISGNAAQGYGAAGGGIYSVGGADHDTGIGNEVVVERSTISGNRVTAEHAYGGGIFTLGGGPVNLAGLHLTNCTVARNLVEDDPALPELPMGWYTRGGGVYLGGGSLYVNSSTIAENEVRGVVNPAATAPNLGGGGIAATIGNAHTVEYLVLRHSIVAGNDLTATLAGTTTESPADVFTGSLLHFVSEGYNLIGVLDFSQILVPVPPTQVGWRDLSRKHYPKVGDKDGVKLAAVVDLDAVPHQDDVVSSGTDTGGPAVLYYAPRGDALGRIPPGRYEVGAVMAGYAPYGDATSDSAFLNGVLDELRTDHAAELGADFAQGWSLSGVTWYQAPRAWTTDSRNAPWIQFWRDLDKAIAGRLGTAGLNDEYWARFPARAAASLGLDRSTEVRPVRLDPRDQLRRPRPVGSPGDIGAIERSNP